jgi:hypothetical protein
MSAAGRGQPPQAAARRPALRKRREGCNDRTIGRIDCPVVPERPPSGQLVSGSGQAGVGGHAGVRGGLTPGQMCSASGRLPPTGHQRGHRGGPCGSPADMTTRAARGRTRVGNRRDPAQQPIEFPVPADRVYAVARGHHLIFGCAHTTGSSTVAALVCSPSRTPEQPDNDLRLEYEAF